MDIMRDYNMWLEHKGLSAVHQRMSNDDLMKKHKNDVDWHQTEPAMPVKLDEDDYIIEDDDDGLVIDDGDDDGPDLGWTPEDLWFCPDGGLTAEAWEFLATTDSEGDFI